MATISDKSVRELAPRATPYRVFERGRDPGFGVQVAPSGARQFFLQYAYAGQRRFLALGTWPTTGIADARARARAARSQLEAGVDPKARRETGTCDDLFRVYVDRLEAAGKRSHAKVRRTLAAEAAPTLGHRLAADITPADIRDVLATLVRRGARVAANRLRSYLAAAFRAGIHHDNDPSSASALRFALRRNPVDDVPRDPAAESVGHRELSWPEIAQAWHADGLSEPYRYAIRLLFATGGQRPSEVLGARFGEFSGEVWAIPPERTKNGLWHLVPLHPLAASIIDELRALHGPRCQWLFPARWSPGAKRHMLATSLAHGLADWIAGADLDQPMRRMKPWTPRDIRRTIKTRLGELGISKDHRDRLQNHALRDVSAMHYDRYDYMAEKTIAITALCERLEQALDGAY